MDTTAAEQLARELMAKHKLFEWRFEWDGALTRCGYCRYSDKIISLSKPYAELNDAEHVQNTILHEIAHALCPIGANHGRLWQLTAMSIGARPERCASAIVAPKQKYSATCPFCNQVHMRSRLSRRAAAQAYCICPRSRASVPKVYLKWELTK